MANEPRYERRQRRRGPLARTLNVFYGGMRLLGRHVRGFYGAVITYLSFAFIIFLGATTAFAVFAEEVVEGDTRVFDEAILGWFEASRTGWLDHVMLELTALGNTGTVVVVVLLSIVFLWETKHRFSVYLLLAAVIGGQLVNTLMKELFGRPRPSVVEWGTDVVTLSFPSGHAMAATVAYGSVAYLVGRLERTRAVRLTTWGIAAFIILLIAVSRVYLGVHYPTDVIAGIVAGLAWTAFVASGIAVLRFYSGRSPQVRDQERDLEARAIEETLTPAGLGGPDARP